MLNILKAFHLCCLLPTVSAPHKFLYFSMMYFAMGYYQESGLSRWGRNDNNFNWHHCHPKFQTVLFIKTR